MLTMERSTWKKNRGPLARATLAERMCSHHSRPIDDFAALAWPCGASWPTRCLRPLILYLAPRYFEAEDFHLDRAADCRWRHEVVEEMSLLRVSYLRRGGWRFFGIGLNGDRFLRYYDHLVALQVIATEAQRVADTENRSRSAMSSK